MAKMQSRTRHRQIIAFMILAVGLSYAIPTVMELKPPRLTPKDALSPLELKELETRALRDEIAALNDRLEVLVARSKLSETAQALAVEKSQQAQNAFEMAEEEARLANEAFDEADLKDKEAQQALRYARMTEAQARDALRVANEKETIAQRALAKATILQREANIALANAQSQSRLAAQTLDEIASLEAKIAELNADLAPPRDKADTPDNETETAYETRRLPKAGTVVVAYENRLVPDHQIASVPLDLDTLDVKSRKERFIDLLLPLIIRANDVLVMRRNTLQKAIAENDERQIARLAKLYGLATFDGTQQALHEALLLRVAPVPNSLALAQAAIESGWGQSRFAKEGNALFGQWAWTQSAGIKPLDASNDRAVIRSFATMYDSVFAYMHNLNTHRAYSDFRDVRADAYQKGEIPSGLLLSRYLTAYAELGEKYVYSLQAMILHNRFDIYETHKLAPKG